MLKPEFITFTGIDDRTDLSKADKLATQYPIEWGVLLASKGKDSRYPCKQAISEIVNISGKKSAHLCGAVSKDFQKGIYPDFADLALFDRIQVNGFKLEITHFSAFEEEFDSKIILQTRLDHFQDMPFLQLYDRSGGEGIIPEHIPSLRGGLVGYAGGMGPDTVLDYLSNIEGKGRFWIDMEGRLRTNGWFDLDKVEQVCQKVYG